MLMHDESFNNSFIFDFQLGFLDALSFLKHLVFGDVLSFYISNKVMFSATLIFEEAIVQNLTIPIHLSLLSQMQSFRNFIEG